MPQNNRKSSSNTYSQSQSGQINSTIHTNNNNHPDNSVFKASYQRSTTVPKGKKQDSFSGRNSTPESRNSSIIEFEGSYSRLSPQPQIDKIESKNSLNNFLSSYERAQSFIGLNLNPDANAEFPGAELPNEISQFIKNNDTGSDIESAIAGEEDVSENTVLIRREPRQKSSRRSSILSNYLIITGDSTLLQTIFNSINVLIGIALLSLPYAIKLSGVVIGSLCIVACYIITMHSAKLLGQVLTKKPHLISYGDIGGYAGGKKIEFLITMLFITDITGALISLSLLFTDSFKNLIDVPDYCLKTAIYLVMFVLTFLPLSYLSFISLFGVLGVISMVSLIFICGFITTESPGSLINPMPINWFPKDGSIVNVMLSLGMFMAPWGGHPIYPELFRDMKDNSKYYKSCNYSFTVTYCLDYLIGIFGVLMYGMSCEDLLIKNMLANSNYPNVFKLILLIIMGILPLLKMPLLGKPIITTYESYFNLNESSRADAGKGAFTGHINFKKIFARTIYILITLTLSLLTKSFGKVVAFLGSAICFCLCMVLPYYFKLSVFRQEISRTEKSCLYLGIFIGTLLAVLGTLGVILAD